MLTNSVTLHPIDVPGNQVTEIANLALVDRALRAALDDALGCVDAVMGNGKFSAISKAAALEDVQSRFAQSVAQVQAQMDEANWSADVLVANMARPNLPEVSVIAEARLAETRAVLRGLRPQDVLAEVRDAEAEKDADTLRAIVEAPRVIRFGEDRATDSAIREQAKTALLGVLHPDRAATLHRLGDVRTRVARNMSLAREQFGKIVRKQREALGYPA